MTTDVPVVKPKIPWLMMFSVIFVLGSLVFALTFMTKAPSIDTTQFDLVDASVEFNGTDEFIISFNSTGNYSIAVFTPGQEFGYDVYVNDTAIKTVVDISLLNLGKNDVMAIKLTNLDTKIWQTLTMEAI